MELIREEEEVDGMVMMGTDNTAAIGATHVIKLCSSHHIWDIFHRRLAIVYNKHAGADLLIKWTLGHIGIVGNEKADKEAKRAVRDGSSPLYRLPALLRKTQLRSKAAAHHEFNWKLKIKAIDLWKESPRHNKLAQIDPNLKYVVFAKLTCNLHRDRASILFQLRAGHIPLNTYLHRIQKMDSPICPSCWQFSETVMHFILHCITYKEARKMLFHKASRDTRNSGKLLSTGDLLPHLFNFIKQSGQFRLCGRGTET